MVQKLVERVSKDHRVLHILLGNSIYLLQAIITLHGSLIQNLTGFFRFIAFQPAGKQAPARLEYAMTGI